MRKRSPSGGGMRALVMDEDVAADLEVGGPIPLKYAGPGYATVGSSGYGDDTEAVALGAACMQWTIPATE